MINDDDDDVGVRNYSVIIIIIQFVYFYILGQRQLHYLIWFICDRMHVAFDLVYR